MKNFKNFIFDFFVHFTEKKLNFGFLRSNNTNLDGFLTIIDEKKLSKTDFMTHLSDSVEALAVTRNELKYIVSGETGFLIYRPNKAY